jgi:hypothetical protein
MSDEQEAGKATPAETQILHYLLNTYHARLNWPSLGPETDLTQLNHQRRIAENINALGIGIGRDTVVSILSGAGGGVRRQPDKVRALAELFRRIDDRIPVDCFEAMSFVDFLKTLAQASVPEDGVLLPARGYRLKADENEDLAGTYVSYRWAFEMDKDYLIAREVLHVFKTPSGLSFRMSFWGSVDKPGQRAYIFEGKVIPVGLSLFFVSLNYDHKNLNRGRSLFVHEERSPSRGSFRIGILTGTRLQPDYGACAAMTMLVKVHPDIPDDLVDGFIQGVTKNALFDTIIEEDFGDDIVRKNWIRACLDNRPTGAEKEPDIRTLDFDKPREVTLRVFRDRFDKRIVGVMKSVLENDKILSSFKGHWIGKPASVPTFGASAIVKSE